MLIGVVKADGRVANLLTPLEVGLDFIESGRKHGSLEARFRFSSPCQESHCGHWAGHECGLIAHLEQAAAEIGCAGEHQSLPPCAIRPQCRWWQQRGRNACAVCPVVVTDQRMQAGPISPPG